MRYAIVRDGRVANVIVWDGSSNLHVNGSLVASDTATVGEMYDGQNFIPNIPAGIKPTSITTRAQALKALANRIGPDAVELLKVAIGTQASASIAPVPDDDPS